MSERPGDRVNISLDAKIIELNRRVASCEAEIDRLKMERELTNSIESRYLDAMSKLMRD